MQSLLNYLKQHGVEAAYLVGSGLVILDCYIQYNKDGVGHEEREWIKIAPTFSAVRRYLGY